VTRSRLFGRNPTKLTHKNARKDFCHNGLVRMAIAALVIAPDEIPLSPLGDSMNATRSTLIPITL
jgi:hypothetical protein